MDMVRQVALLPRVEDLLSELQEVSVELLKEAWKPGSKGIPPSAMGDVVGYLRRKRPSREELLTFLRAAPSLDQQQAPNKLNPLAHQKALAGSLIPWLEENPELSPEDILFIWGWVQGRLPRKQEAARNPALEQPSQSLEFGPDKVVAKVAGQKSEPQNATAQDLAARFNRKL